MLLSDDGLTLIEVNNNDLTEDGSFIIPPCVTSIGYDAFLHCTNLEQINIPEGVRLIGRGAFWGCQNLRQVNIPKSVTTIGIEAFWGCQNLRQINIPEGVSKIDWGVFWGCRNLRQIDIPEGISKISGAAFLECTNLQQINLPESLTSINLDAFWGCLELKTIFINSSEEGKRATIVKLLPENLRKNVVAYSKEQIVKLWNKQLNRILERPETNQLYRFFNNYQGRGTLSLSPSLPSEMLVSINQSQGEHNLYYRKAKALMRCVPLPKGGENKQAYEIEIQTIADECMQKAIEFNEKLDHNNYSFLLDALSITAALGVLALGIAALVTMFVIGSQALSGTLLVASIGCGVAAAGIFFYRSCVTQKEAVDVTSDLVV